MDRISKRLPAGTSVSVALRSITVKHEKQLALDLSFSLLIPAVAASKQEHQSDRCVTRGLESGKE